MSTDAVPAGTGAEPAARAANVAVAARPGHDPGLPAPHLALCGATVVTSLDPVSLTTADVVIAGDRIASVGTAPAGVARRDCSGTLILPGNVCAHHHLYSALSRGMPYRLEAPRNFLQILQRIWWRLDRALDEPTVRLSALVGGLDALRAGTTTVIDHHASPNFIDGSLDVIADALAELGLRSVLCYEVTDRDGAARAAAGVAENRRFLARPRPLARGMMGAHASFTLGDDTLAACAEAAATSGVGVHIHVAEDGADQQDAEARLRHARRGAAGPGRGAGPGCAPRALRPRHRRRRSRTSAHRGAAVAHNPRSNMNNRVGYSPLAHRGTRVALGTDGIGGDMIAESQAGVLPGHRGRPPRPTPAGRSRRLAEGARIAGRSLRRAAARHASRPGAPADLTVLSYPSPDPLDRGKPARPLGLRLCPRPGPRRDRGRRTGRRRPALRPVSTRSEIAQQAAARPRGCGPRLDEIPPHPFTPKAR